MTEPTRDSAERTMESLERTMHTYRKAWEDSKAEVAALRRQVEELTKERDEARSKLDCIGCGGTIQDAIDAVLMGKAACCPDCSTLSVGQRNRIRNILAAYAQARAAQERL